MIFLKNFFLLYLRPIFYLKKTENIFKIQFLNLKNKPASWSKLNLTFWIFDTFLKLKFQIEN